MTEKSGHLLPADALDARGRDAFTAQPTRRAANIPLAELRERPYELPPVGAEVAIAETGPEADQAFDLISEMGRRPQFVDTCVVEPTEDRFRLWKASSLLESTETIPPARALCLACGVGREAVVLAALGWRVTAIDILPDAIDRGRRLERAYVPSGCPAIKWICADLRRSLPDELGEFDLVTQFFYSDAGTAERVSRGLTAGGIALLEAFSEQHWRSMARPRAGRFMLPDAWPEPWEATRTEDWHEGRHTVRVVARLPDQQPEPND